MADTLVRVSVSVWLPAPAHAALAAAAATEGVSVAVLARRAAVAAVESAGGRVGMPAPTAAAVEELRSAGYEVNRLLPAANAAPTNAQQAAIGERISAALDRITVAAEHLRLTPPTGTAGGDGDSSAAGWRLVRVTVDPGAVQLWSAAAGAAGFRSVANWVRDGLAGLYGVAVARPPAPSTIDARAVVGRVLGLVAQTETAVADWPISVPGLDRRVEAAGDALWAALESLIGYGGDPKARR